MAKKKIGKKSKRRLAIFAPLSLLIIISFVFTFISYTLNITRLAKEEKELKEKLATLEVEEKDLNIEINKLKDPEYIAKYAREKYYYSKDGEYVIKYSEKDEEKKDNTNYIIGFGIFALLTIFIFILRRKKDK